MTVKDGQPCKKCGTISRYRSGACKRCTLDNQRKYRQKYPEKKREEDRRYAQNNPEKLAAKRRRFRTKKTWGSGSYTGPEWKALCEQYDNRCVCCGKRKPLTFDHVIPVSKGGSSDISNGQPLCLSCNSSKQDKTTDYRSKPGILRWVQKELL